MENLFGEVGPFTISHNSLESNPYPVSVILPEECLACNGADDNCSFHQTAGVTVDRFETDGTIWQADRMELSDTGIDLNHLTMPINSQPFFPQIQPGRGFDNQFAALSLYQQQPLNIAQSIQDAYNAGDKTTLPLPDPYMPTSLSNYVPEFQLPDSSVTHNRNDNFSVYSDPLPRPHTKRTTWANIAELSLDTRQQLSNDIDPRYLSPQTDLGVSPFQPNGSPSEPMPSSPVLKKKALRLEMSMRNELARTSRRATNGNSSRRASSPGARSVASRKSTASRRGRARKASYSTHLHPEDAKAPPNALPCSRCERTFTNKSELHHHELIHGDRCFVCDVCDKGFFWNKDLIRHMPKHTKEKRYKCGSCPKFFTRHDNLRRHYRTDHPALAAPSCSSRNGSGTVNSSQS